MRTDIDKKVATRDTYGNVTARNQNGFKVTDVDLRHGWVLKNTASGRYAGSLLSWGITHARVFATRNKARMDVSAFGQDQVLKVRLNEKGRAVEVIGRG